jgi:hypothetical protein
VLLFWQALAGGLMLVCPDADGLERHCWRALRGRDGAGSVVYGAMVVAGV